MKNILFLLSFIATSVLVAGLSGLDMVTAGLVSFAVGSLIGEAKKRTAGAAFTTIPVQDARNVFTKMLLSVYKEKITPMSFLRSFFPAETVMAKEISIQVRRGTEYVAVDVERGTNGNRNTFSKTTEKSIVPPFYWEYLTCNEHKLYDVAIGMQHETAFTQLTNELADDMVVLRDKIERAAELQCAQVLMDGIVTLDADTNIDYKRKAGSLVDLSATPWDDNSNNPLDHLKDGAEWLRKNGKAQGGTFNVIMSDDVYSAFQANTNVTNRADIRRFSMDELSTPQKNAVGGVFHGEVSAGSYRFNIWTYPEYYQDSNGVLQPYIHDKKFVILPLKPNFKLSYGLVPQLITDGGIKQSGQYLTQEFIDERASTHEMHIKAAQVAVPVAIDQMYTGQALA